MILRIHGIDVRNRPGAIALAVAALAVGAVLLAFGIVLLIAVAAIVSVIGGVVLVGRAITGRGGRRLDGPSVPTGLDPALEVFPVDAAAATPLPTHNPARHRGAGSQALPPD
jgi:hypothetical protein